jgi:hypothetical protein
MIFDLVISKHKLRMRMKTLQNKNQVNATGDTASFQINKQKLNIFI